MSPDSLATYRQKRSADRTPEPFGGAAVSGLGVFCVQKHAASRTHYDLRLELDGVLKSWAVPKGVSPDPADKRLAVLVEDHPIEYVDFEGIIPDGQYGAGEMILWDVGRWIPLEDPREGLESGKLLFELQGHKLRGVWTLVRIRKGETGKEWLLIREKRGGHPILDQESLPEASVLSGLTVEELADTRGDWDPAATLRDRVAALEDAGTVAARTAGRGVKRRTVDPRKAGFMLATVREAPFSDPEWLYEVKLDGYRMLAARVDGEPLILTRAGNDATASFPEVARTLGRLPFEGVILDGEIVVHDAGGLPSFQGLQKRARLSRPLDVQRAAVERPASFYAFDLLAFEDADLRALPLRERKELLRLVIPPAGPFRYSEHFAGAGEALYEQVEELGLEGIIAKRADSAYRRERSKHWLKIHAPREEVFAIVGYTKPKKGDRGFGALHLAAPASAAPDDPVAAQAPTPAAWVYRGRVGTGFTDSLMAELFDAMQPLRTDPPVVDPAPAGSEHVWVRPDLAALVRYKEITGDGVLRQPSFRGRAPSSALESARERASADESASGGGRETPDDAPAPTEPVQVESGPPDADEVPLSNQDKIFWPEEGLTKGDLVGYYRAVSPWLLPILEDRPLVLTRFPDGIHGKSFFQKHAPGFQPDWVRTVTIWSEGSEREIDYFVAESEAALAYLANLGTIPLHIWGSRLAAIDRPDWCLLDLDPKEAPFGDVIRIARLIHDLCEEIGLPSYPKTSGSTGIHVLIPLGGQLDYEACRTLGGLLARLIAAELPEIATTVRNPKRRDGKVYIDFVQNGRGRLVVAPYSARPVEAASVSAPLRWKEVNSGLTIDRFTLRSMPRRLRSLKDDPLDGLLTGSPDLMSALEALQTRFAVPEDAP